MRQFISDHTPNDDYRKMMNQAIECLEPNDIFYTNAYDPSKIRRTWLLTGHRIAAVHVTGGSGGQMKKFINLITPDKEDVVMTPLPFFSMDIIDKVYFVYKKNKQIIAIVRATRYYINRPYCNEYEEYGCGGDIHEYYFQYFSKKVYKKIKWPEDLPAADRLMKTLESLKTLKKA